MYQPKYDYSSPYRSNKYRSNGLSSARTSLRYPQDYYPKTDRQSLKDPISLMLPSHTQSANINIRIKLKGEEPDILRTMDIPSYRTPWRMKQQDYQKPKQSSTKQAFQYQHPMSYRKNNLYDNSYTNLKYNLTDRSNSIRKQQKPKQQLYHSSYLNQRIAQIKKIYRRQPSSTYSVINNTNLSKDHTFSPSKYNSYSSKYSQLNPYSSPITKIQKQQIPYIGLKQSRKTEQISKEPQPKTTSRIIQYISNKIQQHNQPLLIQANNLQTRQSISEKDNLPERSRISILQNQNNNNNNTIKQQPQDIYISSNQIIQTPFQQKVITPPQPISNIPEQQQNNKFNNFKQTESIIPSYNPSQLKGSEIEYIIKAHQPIISQIKQSLQIKQPNNNEVFNLQQFKETVSNNPSRIKQQNIQDIKNKQQEVQNQKKQNQQEKLYINNDEEIVPQVIKSPTFNKLPQDEIQNNFNKEKQQNRSQSPQVIKNSNSLNEIISRTVEPVIPSNPFVNKRSNKDKEQQKKLFNRPGVSALRSHSNQSKSITEMRQCPIGKNIIRTRGITMTKLQKSVEYVDVPERIAKNWSQMQL